MEHNSNSMANLTISRRFFGKMKPSSSRSTGSTKQQDDGYRADRWDTTTSTASDNSGEIPLHIHVSILSEGNLNSLWKDLKKGVYSSLKSIKFSFDIVPSVDISKMKHLGDVFAALGKLPHLQDLEFCNATLFLPSLTKLFKKSSSLNSLKFHHCKFILATKSKKDTADIQKLWDGVRLQTDLTVLEIIGCSCRQYQGEEEEPQSSFQIPTFLLEHELSSLKRLVLDQFLLESSTFASFDKLLSNNASLEELEIHPIFQTDASRRRQYQAKKTAIREFLLEVVPATLTACNNHKLNKFIVSIDDYHLESVYADAMAHWIDLVEHDNHSLTDLRATKHPLGSSASKEQDTIYGLESNAWLHCNLQYYLRLNQVMAKQQHGHNNQVTLSPQDIDKEAFLKEILPEAYDLSCLHQLLQPNPDIMDASTQSVPCTEEDIAQFLVEGSTGTRRNQLMKQLSNNL